MLRLMVDTSVWLDLAKGVRGEQFIAATRVLVHVGRLELLVPEIVLDEYDRNRQQVIAKLGQSTRANVRLTRAALAKHGRSERNQELIDELDDRLRSWVSRQTGNRYHSGDEASR